MQRPQRGIEAGGGSQLDETSRLRERPRLGDDHPCLEHSADAGLVLVLIRPGGG